MMSKRFFRARSHDVRGRGLIALLACVLVAGGAGIGVYLALASTTGHMPVYAKLAPADAPMFMELTLPGGTLDRPERLIESRLLSETGHAKAHAQWQRLLDETSWGENGTVGSIRRVALVPLDPALTLIDSRTAAPALNGAMGIVVEFDNAAARDQAIAVRKPTLSQAIDHDGKALLALTTTHNEADLETLVERIRTPAPDNLATSERLRDAIAVNRKGGLFVYMDSGTSWHSTREALANGLAYTGGFASLAKHQRNDLVAGLDELLAPHELGALGIWAGLDQIEAVQHVKNHPLYRSGLFARSDKAMLARLPKDTVAFAKVGLFERSATDTLDYLAARSPSLWRFAEVALESGHTGHTWESLEAQIKQLGDHATGQIALGLCEFDGVAHLVLAAGVEDAAALARTLTRKFDVTLTERNGHHVLVDEPHKGAFFDDEAFVLVCSLGTPRDDSAADRYLAALNAGTMRATAATALKGVDAEGTFVAALQPRRLVSLLGSRDTALASVEEALAGDAWVAMSSRYDGTYDRTRVNVGLRDLAGLGLALAPHGEHLQRRAARWWRPIAAAASGGGNQVPQFARYLPADAPLLIELPIPDGLFDNGSDIFTASRLLNSAGREELQHMNAEFRQLLSRDTETDFNDLAELRRVGLLPMSFDFTLAFEPGSAFAVLFEFDSEEGMQSGMRALRDAFQETFHAVSTDDDRHFCFFTNSTFRPEIERFAESLRNPPADSLAELNALRDAITVNRGDGLFVYANISSRWSEMREQLRDMMRDWFWDVPDAEQRELFSSLEQLFNPRELGATGLFLGEDSTVGVQHVAYHPIYRSGILGQIDDGILARLPASTFAYMQLGLLDKPAEEVIDYLKKRAPRLWRFLQRAYADRPEDYQWDAVFERGAGLFKASTGQAALGVATIDENDWSIFTAEINDRDAALEAIRNAFPYDVREVEERDGVIFLFEDYYSTAWLDEEHVTIIAAGDYHYPGGYYHEALGIVATVRSSVDVYMSQQNGIGDLQVGTFRMVDRLPGSERTVMDVIGLEASDFGQPVWYEVDDLWLTISEGGRLYGHSYEIVIENEIGRLSLSDDGETDFEAGEGYELVGLYERYHEALESIGTLRGSRALARSRRGLDADGWALAAVNLREYLRLHDDPYWREPAVILGQELVADDEWVGLSIKFDGDQERLRTNIGLVDLAGTFLFLTMLPNQIELHIEAWREADAISFYLHHALNRYFVELEGRGEIPEGTHRLTAMITEDLRTLQETIDFEMDWDFQYFALEDVTVEVRDGEHFPYFEIVVHAGRRDTAPRRGYLYRDSLGRIRVEPIQWDPTHTAWYRARSEPRGPVEPNRYFRHPMENWRDDPGHDYNGDDSDYD